jgi:L-ribulokinase
MSSEWIFPKIMQVLDEDREIYDSTARFIEGGDWIVEQLCGQEARSSCQAGYKGMWDSEEGFPSPDLLKALDPALENIAGTKLCTDIQPLGTKAGELTFDMANRLGLQPGTAVGVAIIDAHAAVPGSGIAEPGKMLMVMGTSTCHMLLSEKRQIVPGMAGCVKDGILPGYYGYEAGQAAVGDIFAWYVNNCVPYKIHQEAQEKGLNVHQVLEERAGQLTPGQSGLVALDWWNGNRSILVDAELSGLILGMTLNTKPEEIYLALLEATAFGTRRIIQAFQENGISITELYACGGLPERNRLLMQVYADVTGLPIYIAKSAQTCALGAAILGSVAAGSAKGGFDSPQEAAAKMAGLKEDSFQPNANNHEKYNYLYHEYLELHDYFGKGGSEAMKRLRKLKQTKSKPV